MLKALQSSDKEPEEAAGSVETTTAAPVAAPAVEPARYRTTVATVHFVKWWQRESSTEPPLNGSHTSCLDLECEECYW